MRKSQKMQKIIYLCALVLVILCGILSRLLNFNNIILDKYLGDALYAVMIYLVFRLLFPNKTILILALSSLAVVSIIEVFQLTGIPHKLRQSDNTIAYYSSIALGTKFSFLDLLSYTIGIFLVSNFEKYSRQHN